MHHTLSYARQSLDAHAIAYRIGDRVLAITTITDGGIEPDPTAEPAEPGYLIARPGDLGTVTQANTDGYPTVAFDHGGLTDVCPAEVVLVPSTPPDPHAPFPQADDVATIHRTITRLATGPQTSRQIAHHLGYDARQGLYYGNAARFLGFATWDGTRFVPTADAIRLATAGPTTARDLLAGALARTPLVQMCASHVAVTGTQPPRDTLAGWVRSSTGLGRTTATRRALTVSAWVDWLVPPLVH